VSTDEKSYNRQDIDYMLRGMDESSLKVYTESAITSPQVYINPNRIESFKIVF
ncbi:DUF7209 family phage structural protein, partial [Klebsiella pneumoniae]